MVFIFLAALPRLFIYAFLGHEVPEKEDETLYQKKIDIIAAVGTGDAIVNMCTGPFIFALGRAVELFVTQTASAKNMEMGGIFLNRGRLLLIMLFIPTSAIFFFTDKILLSIGE